MKSLLAVAFGGAVGAVLRYLTTMVVLRLGSGAAPWGTLFVNVIGAMALGFIVRYFAPSNISPTIFLALTVGLCGGYTTFSTFTLDMYSLFERGEVGRGMMYAVASVTLSYGAFAIGHIAGRMMRPLT